MHTLQYDLDTKAGTSVIRHGAAALARAATKGKGGGAWWPYVHGPPPCPGRRRQVHAPPRPRRSSGAALSLHFFAPAFPHPAPYPPSSPHAQDAGVEVQRLGGVADAEHGLGVQAKREEIGQGVRESRTRLYLGLRLRSLSQGDGVGVSLGR